MLPNVEYTTDKFIPDNVSYSTKYIAYLDILGFRSLINMSKSNFELRTKISQSLTSLYLAQPTKYLINPQGKHINLPKHPDGISTYIFSDNILITAPETLGGLNKIVNEIWNIFGILAYNCESLIRGALVKGEIYDDTQIVFGPGLIDAYEKETTVSVYPRVIFSNSVKNDYLALLEEQDMSKFATKEYHSLDEKNFNLQSTVFNKQPIRLDQDGLTFLDVLECRPTWIEKYDESKDKRSHLSHKDWLQTIKKIIVDNLNMQHDEKIIMKYNWLKSYFNLINNTYYDYGIGQI